MMFVMKIIGMFLAGAGGTLGTIFGLMSCMKGGDEMTGGMCDVCFCFAFLGAAVVFLARWEHWLSMAY